MRGALCSLPNIPDSLILFLGGCWGIIGNPQISIQLLRKPTRTLKLQLSPSVFFRSHLFPLISALRAFTFFESPRWSEKVLRLRNLSFVGESRPQTPHLGFQHPQAHGLCPDGAFQVQSRDSILQMGQVWFTLNLFAQSIQERALDSRGEGRWEKVWVCLGTERALASKLQTWARSL